MPRSRAGGEQQDNEYRELPVSSKWASMSAVDIGRPARCRASAKAPDLNEDSFGWRAGAHPQDPPGGPCTKSMMARRADSGDGSGMSDRTEAARASVCSSSPLPLKIRSWFLPLPIDVDPLRSPAGFFST